MCKLNLICAFSFAYMLVTTSSANVDIQNVINNLDKPEGNGKDTLVEAVLNLAESVRTLEDKVANVPHLEEKVRLLENEVVCKHAKIEEMEHVIQGLMTKSDTGSSKSEDSVASTEFETNPGASSFTDVTKFRGKRQTEEIAFSTLLSNDVTHIGDKQAIKFDTILLNDGSAYEPRTGVFTAPTPGTYIFLYSLGHHGTGETWLELVKDGVRQNGVAVEGQFSSQNLQGSNSAILRLATGDMVWVDAYQVPDTTAQNTFTTFSGALLF